MKKISSRKFVICGYYNKEVPKQAGGCCDSYNMSTGRCGYKAARISKRQVNRLSEREEIYRAFSSNDNDDNY
jgi:Zn ribbon nucleic-acid-binding protein